MFSLVCIFRNENTPGGNTFSLSSSASNCQIFSRRKAEIKQQRRVLVKNIRTKQEEKVLFQAANLGASTPLVLAGIAAGKTALRVKGQPDPPWLVTAAEGSAKQ